MSRFSEAVREARLNGRLSEALMGKLVGLDESRVRQIEGGESEPSPDELDVYAQVFGVSLTALARGEAKGAPLTRLFFRSMSEGGDNSLEELIVTGAHRHLGEFVRCTSSLAELEALLGHPPPPPLPAPPPDALKLLDGPPPHGAEQLSEWLRAELGLGLEPIRSMQELVTKRLGVQLFWTSPEALDPTIDGACSLSPRPAILVNLVEGPQCWWRTRMTLGHELCHLLCDQGPSGERFALFSPRMPKASKPRWQLFEGFERVERRASAFAACFLAPKEAVRQLVGRLDVTSEEAIRTVGLTFGLGRTTAINRLQSVFGFGKQVRLTMEARSANHWANGGHADRVEEGVGLRSGVLATLALEAFRRGLLDRVRVREYLRLPFTEPLPEGEGLSAEQRAPLRRVQDSVRGVVQRFLQEEYAEAAECVATEVVPAEGGWQVTVEGYVADDAPVPCGDVLVSYDLTVREPRLDVSALRAGRRSRHGRDVLA